MKIRNSFVSNSSSSSFVIVGYEIPATGDWEIIEELEEDGFSVVHGSDVGLDRNKHVAGYKIARFNSEDCWIEPGIYSMNFLKNKVEKLKERFNIEGEALIYVGNESC